LPLQITRSSFIDSFDDLSSAVSALQECSKDMVHELDWGFGQSIAIYKMSRTHMLDLLLSKEPLMVKDDMVLMEIKG
jgi:hypothetical protein